MKITSIKAQVKTAGRYSVFVDEKYSFSLSEGALLESKIASGQEIDSARLKELKQFSATDKAYMWALNYVAIRPRSTWEMQSYFQRKDVEKSAAQQIIEKLQANGLLDDFSFARSWVSSRRALKTTSKRRLNQELKQKRVPEEIINQVLSEDDTNELEVLKQLVERKRKQAKYQDDQKLMQYLVRQGFSYGDIKSAITDDGDF